MKGKCSICKRKKKIVEKSYCNDCWNTIDAPFNKLLENGRTFL